MGNFFSWIKVIRVDQIHRSCRLYISKIRPELIHIQSISSIEKRLTRSRVIYKISIHYKQQAWSRSSYSTLDVLACPYSFMFIKWCTDPPYPYALIYTYFLISHIVLRLIINDSFMTCYKTFTLPMIRIFFYPISLLSIS